MLLICSGRRLASRSLAWASLSLSLLLGGLLSSVLGLLSFISVRILFGLVLLVTLCLLSIDLSLGLSTSSGLLVSLSLVSHLLLGSLGLGSSLLGGLLGLRLLGLLLLGLLGLRLLGLNLLLDDIDRGASAENLPERKSLSLALESTLLKLLLEDEARLVLALLDSTSELGDSAELKHVLLVISLRELGLHALPDLLAGGATALIESEQGDLDHLEVGVLSRL